MSDLAIRTENLTRDFGNLRAVDKLSLEVPSGMIYGFLGPNGSGKTTTIHLLLGLLEPTEGRASVLGFDSRTEGDQVRAHVGALLEDSGLYEQLSVEDNLNFYGLIWHLPTSERESRIRELLTQMGLWERRKESVGTWSRGMKRRLALARAVLHRPQLVFLDEPTEGLDVMASAAVRDDLATMARVEGVTIFLTTHNMAEAERLCHQIAVLHHGRLVTVGRPDELRARGRATHVDITCEGLTNDILTKLRTIPDVVDLQLHGGHLKIELGKDADAGPLVTMLVNAGVVIGEVRRDVPSLEEVFIELMREE